MSVWDDIQNVGGRVIDPLNISGINDEDEDRASRYASRHAQKGIDAWEDLYAPTAADFYAREQQLTPDEEAAASGAQADPFAKAAQRAALQRLSGMTRTEMTAEERAMMAQQQRQEEQFLRGQRQAGLGQMAARGMAGSGMELAANMAAQEEAAGRMSQQGLQGQANAQQRALLALQHMGSQAEGMRTGSFDEAYKRAQAQDELNKFNQENTRDWNKRDAEMRRMAVENQFSSQRDRAAGLSGQYRDRATDWETRRLEEQKRESERQGNVAGAGTRLAGK